MRSMRARLFLVLIAATGLVWLFATAWVYLSTRAEVEHVLDARLMEAARMVSSLVDSQEIDTAVASLDQGVMPKVGHSPYERQLSCQIWSLTGTLIGRSDGAPAERLSDHPDGFAEQMIGGDSWRVYAITDKARGVQVLVGDNLDIRARLVRDMVKGLVLPMALILPVLAAILWFGVGRGLKPLSQLAAGLESRDAEDLHPLPQEAATASEIGPVVTALNGLFRRVADARERERQFLAYAAHELRTPLSGLKTQAEIALKANRDETRTLALNHIVTAVERTARLVRQLLAMAEAEAVTTGNAKPLSLLEAVREAAAGQEERLAAGGGHLRLDPSLHEIRITANEMLLSLALRNLVDNAVGHSPADGTVSISWTGDAIAVEDEGPGMSDAEIARATSRFFRGSNRTPVGSGLGLAIVEIAAEKLGGRLILARREPRGLRADLHLRPDAEAVEAPLSTT
ncbi:ATP-binding protein [Aurantimonas sp. VKM B-3413]|uniref:ATP-binding protein n=1 Tax=Aurantimonas sp. VKM B-3413 TaxID=2779401 RepID=UPI001E455956|nr:ATP-binding protein [Aurantimonas sp. VKM B-3413]MCB8839907.1 sensor histidine kinase N-terminal domain-containing protein [Aurantimonas sp. VKM B-3413]